MEKTDSEKSLKSLQQKHNEFLSKLEELYKCNPQLAQELKMWPRETEWRPASTFKYPDFKWELSDRLNSFKHRLIEENLPKYKDVIDLYCELFLKLEINPFNFEIDQTQKLWDTLSKKQ